MRRVLGSGEWAGNVIWGAQRGRGGGQGVSGLVYRDGPTRDYRAEEEAGWARQVSPWKLWAEVGEMGGAGPSPVRI